MPMWSDFLQRNRFAVLALAITALVAGSVSVASAAGGLVNGGFEQARSFGSTDLGPGWSYIQTQYTYGKTGHLTVNSLPAAHHGSKSVTITAGEGEQDTGSIIQTIQLPTGTYDFTLSGWTWQYESDTKNNAAWVRGDLYTEPSNHIVGDPGWFGAAGSDTNTAAYNGSHWAHLTNTFTNVKVQGSVSLVVTERVNGYGNTGHGAALSDDWSLTSKKVK